MKNINNSNWKKFKVKDVFGNCKLGKYHSPESLVKDENGYLYICASNQNNGINKDMPRVNGNNIALTKGHIISWGKQCPMFSYHNEPCVTAQGMYYIELPETIDEAAALFVCSVLTSACKGKYGYSNCLIGSKMDEIIIKLPVKENNEPDWKYMQDYIKKLEQDYIKELEQDYIRELEQYLIVTGLNDYELTDEDREVLGQKIVERETSYQDRNNENAICDDKEVRKFMVSSNNQPGLFKCSRGTRLTKQNRKSGNIPLLTAGNGIGEGVAEFIDQNTSMKIHEKDITIDMFGSAFYHDYQHYGDDNIHFLVNDDISELVKLYITSMINKKLSGVHSYGYQFRMKNLDELSLALPIQLSSDNSPIIDPSFQYHPDGFIPDWEYMEKYIRAIEKLVIKDVVKYKDEMIGKMREVTSRA